ncbi:MAG: hypothetical protein AB8F78_14010 [Saprospiraceae bacterium]
MDFSFPFYSNGEVSLKDCLIDRSSIWRRATVIAAMNVQTYLNTIVFALASIALLLTGCAKDDFVVFADGESGSDDLSEYQICSDTTLFSPDRILEASDITGKYVKTRELLCGVAGCSEAPFVPVLFIGFQPSIELAADGMFVNAEGPFERFETWSFNSAINTDAFDKIELKDDSAANASFEVSILTTGACRLRIENAQGWIEYTRLDEV